MPNKNLIYIYRTVFTLVLAGFGYVLFFNVVSIKTEIVQGVISGIFTTFLLWFFNDVWSKIIFPWYKEAMYTGAEITGDWQGVITYAGGNKNEMIYTLNRLNTEVSGEAKCIDGNEQGLKWSLNGYFENSILTLTYHCLDNTKIDKGSVTLMLINNGDSLDGHINYYSDNEHRIKSGEVKLRRKASIK